MQKHKNTDDAQIKKLIMEKSRTQRHERGRDVIRDDLNVS